MKLRFAIDRAAAFRRGRSHPPVAVITVDPSEIPDQLRERIADRMVGVNDECVVCRLGPGGKPRNRLKPSHYRFEPDPIVATEPTLEALLVAVEEDQKRWEEDENRSL